MFCQVTHVGFGRDNTGVIKDKCEGTYTVQFTTDLVVSDRSPNAIWTTVGSLDYSLGAPSNPSVRHLYELATPVVATGIRLVLTPDIAIDELEVYGTRGTSTVT